MQQVCWPDLAVEPHDTERMTELCRRLLDDVEFRTDVVKYAQQRVKEYASLWEQKKSQVWELINDAVSK